ncbi:hypothetical protein BDZ97DRAFT_1761105 [Flammula alnicola]|nr:hypothetical protein BDZ97DRAFT_1761105 [Flammula alnicola]
MSLPSHLDLFSAHPKQTELQLSRKPGEYEHYTAPDSHPRVVPQGKSKGRRVLRGIIFAAFTYSLIKLSIWRFRLAVHHDWPWAHNDLGQKEEDSFYDIPQGLSLDNCVEVDDWYRDSRVPKAQVSLQVPVSSKDIFFISRGCHSDSSFNIVSSPHHPKDSVTFSVVAEYNRDEIRNSAKVCLISRGEGGKGFGILTPGGPCNHHSTQDDIHFRTTMIFPQTETGQLFIESFQTDLPNTRQTIHQDLASNVFFENISLKGKNALIDVRSLSAGNVRVETSAGPIHGTFNTTTFLTLTTSNSPIKVDVGLTSNGTSPTFIAKTTNSPLHAEVSLFSSSKEGGSFHVSGTTTNSPVYLGFPEAPVDSTLRVEAETKNSPASVFLHPTFEGSFSLESTVFQPEVQEHGVVDPTGKGRIRRVQVDRIDGDELSGKVLWEREAKKPIPIPWPLPLPSGAVFIHTTNSPAVLDL